MEASAGRRLLELRRDDVCSRCGLAQPKGTEAWWSRAEGVTCRPCVEGAELALRLAGTGGGSAQREYERRSRRDAERRSARFGRLAPVVAAFSDPRQSTESWAKGANGERALAALLDQAVAGVGIALHDRRVPRSQANIDHVVVVPSGIWVVDAKAYAGKVREEVTGSFFNPTTRLVVGRRDCSRRADAVLGQVEVAAAALGADRSDAIPLRAALCFVGSDWSLFAKPFEFRGVLVTWPAALAKRLGEPGPLDGETVGWLAARLALSLRAAS